MVMALKINEDQLPARYKYDSRACHEQRSKTASEPSEKASTLEEVTEDHERSEKPDYCGWQEFYISKDMSTSIEGPTQTL